MSSDKAYTVAAAHAALVNRLAGMGLGSNAETFTGGDGNTYACGELTQLGTGASQLVNATGDAAVNGLTATVNAHSYRVRAKVVWTQGATASNQKFGLTGPSTSLGVFTMISANMSANFAVDGRFQNSLSTVAMGAAAWASGAVVVTEIDCIAAFTAGGTLAVAAACTVAANTFTVNNPYCWLELRPLG